LRIILTTSPAGTEADVQALARFDAVAWSYRAPAAQRAAVRALRPDQVHLCFVGSMNLSQTWGAGWWEAAARETCEARGWWVVDNAGARVEPWPGEWAINLTIPEAREWYARTLVDSVLPGFDGLLLDQVHRGIGYMAPAGLPFTDGEWAAAVTDFLRLVRARTGALLIANGSLLPEQAADLDGWMAECWGHMAPLRGDWDAWRARFAAMKAACRNGGPWMVLCDDGPCRGLTGDAETAEMRRTYAEAMTLGAWYVRPPWSGTDWREEYENTDWWPVQHFVFGMAPGTYCVTQGELSLGRASDAGGVLTFSAPLSAPVSILACPAGQRPSMAEVE